MGRSLRLVLRARKELGSWPSSNGSRTLERRPYRTRVGGGMKRKREGDGESLKPVITLKHLVCRFDSFSRSIFFVDATRVTAVATMGFNRRVMSQNGCSVNHKHQILTFIPVRHQLRRSIAELLHIKNVCSASVVRTHIFAGPAASLGPQGSGRELF